MIVYYNGIIRQGKVNKTRKVAIAMKKTINNSATKAVEINTNASAAAFAKDAPQMYARSEVVIDSAFINEVVGHLVATIFSGIKAGASIAQQNQRARDERALWLKKNNLTAGEVADLLCVPGCQQMTQETVEVQVPTANEESKSQETVEAPVPVAKEEPKQSRKHHRHGGRKHRKPVAQQATVPPTVKRPARSPMENLNHLMASDPLLAMDLIAVLRKHNVTTDQIFED